MSGESIDCQFALFVFIVDPFGIRIRIVEIWCGILHFGLVNARGAAMLQASKWHHNVQMMRVEFDEE